MIESHSYMYMYLIVDSCNDSCSNPHANDVSTVEVLVEDQGLD